MELKCKQGFLNIVDYDEDAVKADHDDDDFSSYDDDDDDNDHYDEDFMPPVSYRSIGIQTQSPFMVDKAIQVFIPRTKPSEKTCEKTCMAVTPSLRKAPTNGHRLMPNIVYGGKTNYYESPLNRINFAYDQVDSEISNQNNNENHKLIGAAKRKQKSPNDEATINKLNKKFVGDESYKHQETDSSDLRIGLISFNDEDPISIDVDTNQTMTMVNRSNDTADDALEIDDEYIFTHHPTGLGYQIFNEKRSINKEMMEQVFASVIGREDKFYLCLYPPHKGSCHSHAGKSTKIRVVKNHLTSHLFLYRCRLCGRTYKYYNNLFNHFNKHP
ncbi:uncharacterized protein LOC107364567 [Tetranychus urticae]|uniref:C2H2-type domain-containing protein n=1 Tax=Tetranychus urticae TaxID=32264 RepID=T1JQS1_TETUR|nr:uncharacterized protein LOC107364567 [Tetranychus urticae]XP_025016768.1 uncharacterized protein LOC107364567 [Tetranychus urticae]